MSRLILRKNPPTIIAAGLFSQVDVNEAADRGAMFTVRRVISRIVGVGEAQQ